MPVAKALSISCLLVALSILPTKSLAQRSYAVGITAGAALPTGKFRDVQSKGMSITAFLGFGSAEIPIGLRLDGMYHTFTGRSVTPPGGGADTRIPDQQLWGIGGNFVVTASGTTAKPYLLAGAGFYNAKADSIDAKSQNKVGFSAGVGSTFNLGSLASVIEVRFHSISRKPADGGSLHFFPIMLGIVF